jgi:PII-like signaling protein
MKMLLMFVNETDTWQGIPLYEAIVERLRQSGVAGATAQTGVMGYGHHIRPGHKGVFAVSDDRPVTIVAIDEEARIRSALPELRGIARHALMVLQNVELVAD